MLKYPLRRRSIPGTHMEVEDIKTTDTQLGPRVLRQLKEPQERSRVSRTTAIERGVTKTHIMKTRRDNNIPLPPGYRIQPTPLAQEEPHPVPVRQNSGIILETNEGDEEFEENGSPNTLILPSPILNPSPLMRPGTQRGLINLAIFQEMSHQRETPETSLVRSMIILGPNVTLMIQNSLSPQPPKVKPPVEEYTEAVEVTEAECLTCCDVLSMIKYLPCSHQVVCVKCYRKMTENSQQSAKKSTCLICRSTIDKVIIPMA